MPVFRVSIKVRSPDGLSGEITTELYAAGFRDQAVPLRHTQAKWTSAPDDPGFRLWEYQFDRVEAQDEDDARMKAHEITGVDLADIRVTLRRQP